MTYVLLIVGIVLMIGGLVGSFVPVLPGLPLSLAGLVMMGWMSDFSEPLTVRLLIGMGVLTCLVTAMDYVLPVVGVRRFGATKWGVWGSVVGLVAGIFIYPPVGMVVGSLLGAVIGELVGGKELKMAVQAGVGVLVGNVVSLVVKLVVWAIMAYYFIGGMRVVL